MSSRVSSQLTRDVKVENRLGIISFDLLGAETGIMLLSVSCSLSCWYCSRIMVNRCQYPSSKLRRCPSRILSEFRPVFITPILSRVTEKIVVRKWLSQSIPSFVIADQYAFKPSGSTDAALISNLFVGNKWHLVVDFGKAFDTVVLICKLHSLGLPANIFNWVMSFLTGQTQYCKINGVHSA